VPLAVLAALGVGALARRIPRRAGVMLLLAATLPTSLILLLGSYVTALAGSPQTVYPSEEIATFNWLNRHSEPGEVVLGSFPTGNRIPAYTNLRVYVGHGPETLDAIAKTALVGRFFAGEMTADEHAALYTSMRIRYIFYGPDERQLAGGAEPNWQEGLTRLNQAGDYEIYAVRSG
ncbi:MAG: hypothetical protein K8J31_19155, partial [Anaerolineae bacterium]|nr:hypothetical protein [Anaerolineae bacterium]